MRPILRALLAAALLAAGPALARDLAKGRTDLPDLDFVALAKGHGLPGERIERADELEAALTRALRHDGPNLVEIVVA